MPRVHGRYFIIRFRLRKQRERPGIFALIHVGHPRFGDSRQPKTTAGLQARKFKNHEFEAFTISWLPHDFLQIPTSAFLRDLAPCLSHRGTSARCRWGKTSRLPEYDRRLAVHDKVAVCVWGPYEIHPEAFDLAGEALLAPARFRARSSIAPTTVAIARIGWRSIASTPWRAWRSCIPMADCSERDS